MSDIIPLDDLAQEANDNHEQVISNAKKAISAAMAAGASLLRAKQQVPHGEWLAWQKTNLTYSQQTASRYMTIAANYSSMSNLKDAKDINDALRMIAERKAEESDEKPITPRAERVTGRVAVSEPDKLSGNPGQLDHSADVNEKVYENAVPPEPRTNTKHSKATAKAKEADRPAPPVVTPEIVDEPVPQTATHGISSEESAEVRLKFAIREVSQVLNQIAVDSERKKAAKQLRKLADELDPPAIGAPSIEAVEAWAAENRLQDFDANKFFNHYELANWRYGKAKTPIKDWKRAAANAYAGGKGWAVDGANRLPF